MRKVNRQEFVDRFRTRFLEGKTENFIEKFNRQPLEKQYGSITRWIKNKDINTAEEITAKFISNYIQRINILVSRLEDLTEDEANALRTHLTSANEAINNFAETKRQQQLESLEAQRAAIEAQIDALRNR